MSADKALKLAEEADMDLVKIAPTAVPPVCKIMDYGKYRFEQQKKEKENKKNQKVVETKEVRLSINIDTNDFNTKVNQATSSLKTVIKLKFPFVSAAEKWPTPNLVLTLWNVLARLLKAAQSKKLQNLKAEICLCLLPQHTTNKR